jgi:hypothetical protein
MAKNPLIDYFRQPKIYISLPSKGMYNKLGSLNGDATNIPIYGMTGMDEIIMKTPDSMLSGESTVKIFESCCPAIKDGWEVTALDTDVLLTAIRIATYSNIMAITHTCPKCSAENDYDVDLSTVIEHFAKCEYQNTIELPGLQLKLQPLTYKQSTEFSIRNFQLQQRLSASYKIEDAELQNQEVATVFVELGHIQNDMYAASIESIDIGTVVVTEKHFIIEWLKNCDKSVFDTIREQFAINKDLWKIPNVNVKCGSCDKDSSVAIDLDQTNFFAPA